MGKKGDLRGFLNMEWLLVPDGLIYWDFHSQPSLGFTENGPKRENIQ